jgi:hypothetical protein
MMIATISFGRASRPRTVHPALIRADSVPAEALGPPSDLLHAKLDPCEIFTLPPAVPVGLFPLRPWPGWDRCSGRSA